MITLDSYELDCIILRGLYPRANKFQIAKGARWRATAFTGANAATYETDPERYRIDLETEMFGEPLPSHEHLVNEHSVVKFNGGNTVFLCGYANGECRIIVCHADWDEATERWVPGRPYN